MTLDRERVQDSLPPFSHSHMAPYNRSRELRSVLPSWFGVLSCCGSMFMGAGACSGKSLCVGLVRDVDSCRLLEQLTISDSSEVETAHVQFHLME